MKLTTYLSYDFDSNEEHCDPFPIPLNETDHLGFGKGCITKSKRAQLIEFAKSTGMKVIFGLNALVGRKQNEPYWNYTGAWDPSNAEDLLNEFSTLYPNSIFAYELGNEVIHANRAGLSVQDFSKTFFRLLVNMVLQLILLLNNTLSILLNCSKSVIKHTKIRKRFRTSLESTTRPILHG